MKIISKQEAIELGVDRYFTGKPCKRGHFSERSVSRRVCIACQKAHEQTPEYKAYRQTPEYKTHRQTPEYKARAKSYNQTPESKAKQKTHRQTPEYKARAKSYSQTPEQKTRRKAYNQSIASTRRQLKYELGIAPPEELVEAVHVQKLIRREIKAVKKQTITI